MPDCSAAINLKETWSGLTCMDPDNLLRHLGLAMKAGQHEAQLTMLQLSLDQVGSLVTLKSVTAQP